MKGFFNKVLRIDLNLEKFEYQDVPDEILKDTLGGKGLASYFLLKENPKGVDPFSPENVFIIATGPVTGSNIWGQARFGVFSKSPATCGYGESYCGGTLPPKIKSSGVDAIIIKGQAQNLKYLVINEDGVEFKDATEIKGANTDIAEEYILKNSPEGSRAMVIGPAGENLVAQACIKSDRFRSLGRGGLGAVLGAKNIKGISFNGNAKCKMHDENLLKQVAKKIAQKGKEAPVTKLYQTLGTPMQVEVTNFQKCFPTRYWYKGHFKDWKKISAPYMQENFNVKAVACPTCFLKCTKLSEVKKGRHQGLIIEGPEYETIYAIGGLNEIDSLEEVAYLNDLCDRLGLDTMSAGNLSALMIEAFKDGKSDFDIDYNMPDKVALLFSMIAHREGVGDILAKGIKQAAKELDMEDKAIHVKGLEPSGFSPRVLKGMGLSYATAARGACHLRGTFYKAELSGQIDKEIIEGKAQLLIDYEDRAAIFDSLVLCRFFRDFILWDEISMIIEGTTGMKLSKDELELLANQITQNGREYNNREGLGPSSDWLPKRFLEEKTEEGFQLTVEELAAMIKEYNQIRDKRIKKR